MADASSLHSDIKGFTPETLNVAPELSASRILNTWRMGDLTVTAQAGRDTLWFVVRRTGQGGCALRSFPVVGPYSLETTETLGSGGKWTITTHIGVWTIELKLADDVLHMTTRLRPDHDLLVTFWPRDLFVMDAADNPCKAQGEVTAAQRGLNGGYCYFCLAQPAFGTVLYMQNLSALNPFFQATHTTPDGVVGGAWPELGYLPPASPTGNSPPQNPLKAGDEVTISDVLMTFRKSCASDEFANAEAFISMLACLYPHIDKPEPVMRDWPARAKQTLKDLDTPSLGEEHYGHRYLRAYNGGGTPDSMVQMAVLAPLRNYERWLGCEYPLSTEIAKGMKRFFDPDKKALLRFLPNARPDGGQPLDSMDSWYLYHPLMNLGHLALQDDAWAADLFLGSLDYAIATARHFNYQWPITYRLSDFSVITANRGEEGLGQTDVGGIYAYVMLLAFEMTGNDTYIAEAKKALKALEDRGFELAYQTNLTAWGALACLKLWKLQKGHYLRQSQVFIAGVLHNCELWSSRIGLAEHYANFFGVTCLHDGPYMAAFEAFECVAAFDKYLALGGDELPSSLSLLLTEYIRFSEDVLWSFYPDTLPADGLAQTTKTGHIDRNLSIPVEDLYGDGRPAGEIGQEVYGAGGAFIMAVRNLHQRAELQSPVNSL